MEKLIKRIQAREKQLELSGNVNTELEDTLNSLEKALPEMEELFRYYGSEQWYNDREQKLPDDISAGVLSEDLIYDQITQLRDSAYRMLEMATDILKNRI